MTTCDTNTIFSSLILNLNSVWSSLWTTALIDAPKKEAIAFGSCYTCCGSLGLTDVNGLESLDVATGSSSIEFTTCTKMDYILLTVPFDRLACTFDTEMRVSGNGILWPSGGPGSHLIPATANISGFILITVPVENAQLLWTELLVDFVVTGQWTTAWPDNTSTLFESIPFESLIQKYCKTLTNFMNKKLTGPLIQALEGPNMALTCTFPSYALETCIIGTSMPNGACHICDTCCKCLVQQRCDGDCNECDCINCKSPLWSPIISIIVILTILIFLVTWTLRTSLMS